MKDITYCADKCLNTECPRHITQAHEEQVSIAKLKGTDECELDGCKTCKYHEPYKVDKLYICTHPFIDCYIAPCVGWMRKP